MSASHRPPGRRVVSRFTVGLALGAMLVGGACGDDGRDLAEPDPDLTAVPVPTTAPQSIDPAEEAPSISVGRDGFAITSARIQPGGPIPPRFTCEGEDISPPLSFTEVPDATAQLAVVMIDIDAGNTVHWAVRGIPPDVDRLEAGTLPPDAVELTNDFGTTGYRGPCPPRGESHRYRFTLFALDANAVELPINDKGGVDIDQIAATTSAWVAGEFRGTAPD